MLTTNATTPTCNNLPTIDKFTLIRLKTRLITHIPKMNKTKVIGARLGGTPKMKKPTEIKEVYPNTTMPLTRLNKTLQ